MNPASGVAMNRTPVSARAQVRHAAMRLHHNFSAERPVPLQHLSQRVVSSQVDRLTDREPYFRPLRSDSIATMTAT